ncbi:phosphodiesterase [Erwinia pyri]|uniref:Phosphodiesterase n=1 Tax=Erwinia pyri TaxID=3062598 RepID=A0AA50DPV0_9GAMM|nr:phosphodiesterase [Erwinia sp. DE2]WLS80011.1 phosphodiesterase [Erwinia sp. DE2]
MTQQAVLIAQISDLHIKAGGKLSYRQVDTLGALRKAISRLNSLSPRPDAVVITGDLVDFGNQEEYQTLQVALGALEIPYWLMVGNHDDRQAVRKVFAGQTELFQHHEFIQWEAECGPLRLLALDSTVPGEPQGELCAGRLNWLEEKLEEQPSRATLVMLHHPPFISGIEHMDRQRLQNPQQLATVLEKHSQVERVLCGHLHRSMHVAFAGTVACSAPGVSHQVALDLRPDGPAHFCLEPAGFLLHRWTPEQGVITHQCVIEQSDGPYPFYDENGLID